MQSQAAAFIRDSAKADGILRPSGERALLIDGRAAADRLLEKVRSEAETLLRRGIKPGLATVLVGDDPASRVYVGSKGKAARACGFHSVQHDLAASASEADLLALVRQLNADAATHGILVQLPLPKAIARDACHRGDRAGKGRRRLQPRQCRADRDRRDGARLRALHAGRRAAPHRGSRQGARPQAAGGGCADRRPLQHCRQAHGAAASAGERHRHHRSFPHAPIFRRWSGAPTFSSPRSAGPR